MFPESKNVYRDLIIAGGIEGLSLLCWYAEASPTLTTTMLALAIAADVYALSKAGSFFYETYQKSANIRHFFIKIDCPFVSSLWKKIPVPHSENLAVKLLEIAEDMRPK